MSGEIDAIVAVMRNSPQNINYEDLKKVCEHYFGQPRQHKTSHSVFKTTWQGDPRVNIQSGKNGKAKVYQVKQVLAAIGRLVSESKEEGYGE